MHCEDPESGTMVIIVPHHDESVAASRTIDKMDNAAVLVSPRRKYSVVFLNGDNVKAVSRFSSHSSQSSSSLDGLNDVIEMLQSNVINLYLKSLFSADNHIFYPTT